MTDAELRELVAQVNAEGPEDPITGVPLRLVRVVQRHSILNLLRSFLGLPQYTYLRLEFVEAETPEGEGNK